MIQSSQNSSMEYKYMVDAVQPFQSIYELQVSEDGTLKLPLELRAALGLQAGDTVTLIRDEDELRVLPTRLLMPELARQMVELMAQKGLTPTDMLAGLAEEGDKLFKEQYGDVTAP